MKSADLPHPFSAQRDERRRRGFTLIEIMAVVLIMGMLMGLVGVAVFQQVDKARVQTTKIRIKNLESALEFYRMDNSRYPSSEQGLAALLVKPVSEPEPRNYPPGGYLQRGGLDALKDAWENKLFYENPGQHNIHSFDIWSLGADEEAGGEDTDADIQNWTGREIIE